MAISAISGFTPAISLIGSLSPLNRVSLLQPTSGLSSLLSFAATQASISDVGRLLNRVETLQTTAAALTVAGLFVARTASVAGTTSTAVATASAGAATPTGSFALQVDQLAQGQTLRTAAQASSLSTIGSGAPTTLSFQFAGGGSRSVTLGTAGNTLAGIATAINSAGIGIEAQLVSSSSGVQLALSGPSGEDNAFTVAVSGDAAIADLLAFPAGGSGGPTLSAAAGDARGQVNGIAFSASTNSVNTGIAGLSLNLLATGTATLTVAANTDAADAVRGFVDAFNEVRSGFSELAGANPVLGLSASFLGAQLSATLNAAGGGNGNPSAALAQIGITSNLDGTLHFNETVFQAALNADQDAVGQVFRNGGAGLAEQVVAQAGGPLSPEQLLPVLTPALTFQGSFGASSDGSLLLSLFGQGSTLNGGLSSSFANDLLFSQLLGAGSLSGAQNGSSLADLMLAEVLFANQF